MIGVAFYKRCRPYKNFKFKAQIGGLFCKTVVSCHRSKNPDSTLQGSERSQTNSWHNRSQGNCAENFSSTWTKSLQHSHNYNQVSHWICSKTKTFLTHKNVDFLSGQLKKIQGRYVVKPQGCVLIQVNLGVFCGSRATFLNCFKDFHVSVLALRRRQKVDILDVWQFETLSY